MAKKGNTNVRKTAARIVMDVFIRKQAVDPESAIEINEFKDVKLSTSVISYTIANFMEENIVCKTGDDRYYFVESKWKELEKKVNRGYWIFAFTPLAVLALFLLLRHWDVVMSWFN